MMHATVARMNFVEPIADELAAVVDLFDSELTPEFEFVRSLCDRVRLYRGKMLRPSLLLFFGQACGSIEQRHRVAAAVVEMVHIATLVHDDVLDAAEARRRQPTVNATEGNLQAVLLGDFLISHAFHLCNSLPMTWVSRMIGAATNRVCEGEMLQNHRRYRADLSERDYLLILECKTAALTKVAAELGALLSDADQGLVAAAGIYGEKLGIAFQIVDDLLDVLGSSQEAGKTLGLDWERGKPTLPVIHALRHGSPRTRERLATAVTTGSPIERERLVEMLQESRSLEYARDRAHIFVEESLEALQQFDPSTARASLGAMAEFVLNRNH